MTTTYMNTINILPLALKQGALALAGALLLATASHAAVTKAQFTQIKADAKNTFATAHAKCEALEGNAEDVCNLQAKADRTRRIATAEAAYKGTPKATYSARKDIADADYKVAKERCDDIKDNEKDVCVKEAKAVHEKAKSDAKVARDTNDIIKEAVEDRTTADYKVAAEKCDALSGDAKDVCVAKAKADFRQ